MKTLSMIAAAALALSAAAPAFAEEKVQSDPFVSTQQTGGPLAGLGTGAAVAGVVALTVIIAATGDDQETGTGT